MLVGSHDETHTLTAMNMGPDSVLFTLSPVHRKGVILVFLWTNSMDPIVLSMFFNSNRLGVANQS